MAVHHGKQDIRSHETERALCRVAGDTASRYAEVLSFTRLARRAAEQCIPVTNYGIAIAQIHGILDRALRPFSALHAEWKKQQQ